MKKYIAQYKGGFMDIVENDLNNNLEKISTKLGDAQKSFWNLI